MDTDEGVRFVNRFRADLIQKVTAVDAIADEMLAKEMIHDEAYSRISAKGTSQEKMRELYDSMRSGSKDVKNEFLRQLKKYHPFLLEDLKKTQKQEQMEEDTGARGPKVDRQEARTNVYSMTRTPRGYCVIINNKNFPQNLSLERRGTDKDACALQETFGMLGFEVVHYQNKSADEIRAIMDKYGKESHVDKDCFVACVLSHGRQTQVLGSDEKLVEVEEILKKFEGDKCPTLVCKPKVFFIQACQGDSMQAYVTLHTDEAEDQSLKEDVLARIPVQADFLIGMATVQNCKSIRDTNNGSWYIQSLCKRLKDSCPKGVDILTILTDVNGDVSRKDGEINYRDGTSEQAKQIPEFRTTLTKTLVFHVPE